MEDNKKTLEIRADVARGTYSNLAIISHSTSEFVIDFATILPGMPQPDISTRILMTPEHAKRLLGALTENIRGYESQFGQIKFNDLTPTFNLANIDPNKGNKS